MRSALFDPAHQERQTNDRWALQSERLLRCALNQNDPEIIASQGAMVAYQGQMDFSYQGSGGGMRMLKKLASGEGANMMRVRGQGEIFLARRAEHIFLLQLEGGNDAITLNTKNMLAFDGSINWDIRTIGGAGFLSGGLFNLLLQGEGMVAVSTDGPPMLLDCSKQPTYVDPQTAVCWSANLAPELKTNFKMGSLVGRSAGETFQLAFHGPGFVVVQPSEGARVVAAQ